jgi:hypothetical protein
MSWSPLRVAMIRARQHAAAVTAATLIYAGIYQIISTLKYPIGRVILRLVNAVIVTGFRDRLLLQQYDSIPWQFRARTVAAAVIVIVLGVFLGLWVNVMAGTKANPEPQNESPRRSEG